MERDRLQAAIPMLKNRYKLAEYRVRLEEIKPRYDDLVAKRNTCFKTMFELYNTFLEQFIPLMESAAKLNTDIRKMNSETGGLPEFKIIPTIAEGLLERIALPAEQGFYWPNERARNALAAQWSEAVAQTCASPLRQAASSPGWAAARAIQDEGKIKEWEQRKALHEEQQLKARQEFERSKQQVSR